MSYSFADKFKIFLKTIIREDFDNNNDNISYKDIVYLNKKTLRKAIRER